MNVDVDGLRAAAEAATAGPWATDVTDGQVWASGNREMVAATRSFAYHRDAAYIAAASPDVVLALLDRLAEVESQLERTEQQIHEPGGFIDEAADRDSRIAAARRVAREWEHGTPIADCGCGTCELIGDLRQALNGPQDVTGADLRASEPQDDHLCYPDALRWAADVAHSEARWQWERDLRRITGAQIVAQRAEVLEACYREAADRHDKQASGAESDHGDRREGEGLA